MTVTLLTSQSAPTTTDADILVIGVFQGTDGPVPTLGTDEIDLLAALTALGATGKPEELTKVHTAGRLTASVILAVGLGPEPKDPSQDRAERRAYTERLRRSAGVAARELTSSRAKRASIALPDGQADEAEAVALGALLGGYAFRKYRTTANTAADVELIADRPGASAYRVEGLASGISETQLETRFLGAA